VVPVLILLIALVLPGAVWPATLTVGASHTYTQIQTAIAAAKAGDVVLVYPGTYNERIDFVGKAITVQSTNPLNAGVVGSTIISGSGLTGSVVSFTHNETSASVLSGFTIAGGTAGYGAGILCEDASPRILHNTISNNTAQYSGGGVYAGMSAADLELDVIVSNHGELGGGVYWATSGAVGAVFKNCLIAHNSASVGGGAGGVWLGGVLTLESDTISDNSAAYYQSGGNAWVDIGSFVFRNCLITFAGSGGGLVSSNTAQTTVSYCDVYGNTGGDYLFMTDPTGKQGNLQADPLYANASLSDYHLKSKYGRWSAPLGGWVNDTVISPCIDRGDPASAFSAEPQPNGARVNMGADGNTAQASKSPPVRLAWAGSTGYTADGVQPDSGALGTTFTFAVKYTNFDSVAPSYVRLYLFQPDGNAYPGGPFEMTHTASTWKTGVICRKALPLSEIGRWSYYFQASAGGATVRWPATTKQAGPVLTASASLSVSAASAQQVGAGVAVTYTLSAPAQVQATILNLAGRVVAEIGAVPQEAGVQALRWNGRNGTGSLAPAGRYLLRRMVNDEAGARSETVVPVRMQR
jgi:hypothetical protein